MGSASAFRNGAIAMLLVFAALNAASYFVRSEHGRLLGHKKGIDRIGFPLLAWQEGGQPAPGLAILSFGAKCYFYYGSLAADVGFALAASLALGLLSAVVGKRIVPREPGRLKSSPRFRDDRPPQFGIRTLLIVTAVIAAILACEHAASTRTREISLGAVYLLGPLVLICSARNTCGNSQTEQVIRVCFVLTALVLGAVVIGIRTDLADFTRVLLGLFVYWVPQCVAILGVHVAWRSFVRSRNRWLNRAEQSFGD